MDGGPTGGIIFVEIQILRHAKAREEGSNLNLGRRIKIDGGNTFRRKKPKTGAERPNGFLFRLRKPRPILQCRHTLQLGLRGDDGLNFGQHFEPMTFQVVAIDEVITQLLDVVDAMVELDE